MEPASIRYKNPGAMWGGSALAKKWGANQTVGLNDGLGQGNNIAVFPTMVKGAAAQIDLWHTRRTTTTSGWKTPSIRGPAATTSRPISPS
jgi:hypothetical protein